MRRQFLVVAGVVSLVAAIAASAAVRKPLFEEFTNVQCPPCASVEPMLETFLDNHPDDLACVYWHMNWPGFDPFWTDNPADNNARRFRYGVNAIPESVMDGTDQRHPADPPPLETRYNTAAAVPSSLNLFMSGFRVTGSGTGTVTVDMMADAALTSPSMFLYVVMAENDVHWNGIGAYDTHYFVCRKTLSGSNGEAMAPFAASETRSRTYTWTLDPDWILPAIENNLVFIAFVQIHGAMGDGGAILNAESIPIGAFSSVAVPPADGTILAGIGANYPNPFNPLTHIPIYMQTAGDAVVSIHAANGALIRTLSQGALPAGGATLTWDGADNAGSPVGSGVYFVRMHGQGIESSRPITLLK